jgi:hypothetical protein
MNTKFLRNALLIAGILFGARHEAAAGDSNWSAGAVGACVPFKDAITEGDYDWFNTAIRSANNSGLSSYRCTIPNTGSVDGTWAVFHMYYVDADGTGTGSRVRAILKSFDFATYTVTTIATLDSNTSSTTTYTERNAIIALTPDFSTKFYYVQVELTRGATGYNEFWGLRLD